MKQKGYVYFELILVGLVVGLVLGVGWYALSYHGPRNNQTYSRPALHSGVDIEVITGAGGNSEGELLDGEEFTVVLTEPFKTLGMWNRSEILYQIKTTSGKASMNVPPGKYGVYYIYRFEKTLYSDLKLENPRSDIPRDQQGPWYVEVGSHQQLHLKFYLNNRPS